MTKFNVLYRLDIFSTSYSKTLQVFSVPKKETKLEILGISYTVTELKQVFDKPEYTDIVVAKYNDTYIDIDESGKDLKSLEKIN